MLPTNYGLEFYLNGEHPDTAVVFDLDYAEDLYWYVYYNIVYPVMFALEVFKNFIKLGVERSGNELLGFIKAFLILDHFLVDILPLEIVIDTINVSFGLGIE